MITPLLAAKAYAAAQSQGLGDVAGASDATGGTGGAAFGDILKNMMDDTVQASRAAEKQMTLGVQGKADLVDVVTALSSAQTSLETVMAVRDQVISAYKEVVAMQI